MYTLEGYKKIHIKCNVVLYIKKLGQDLKYMKSYTGQTCRAESWISFPFLNKTIEERKPVS